MSQSHFSHNWYRVARLKPSLRNHVEMHPQTFRGETWYVVQDAQSGKYFRISPATYAVVCRFDGHQEVAVIWEEEGKKLGKDQPTQAEMLELMAQLYRSDLIRGDVPPDFAEFTHRSESQEKQRLLGRYKNPLALRFPLVDPDRFLTRFLPLVQPFFSRWGLIAWIALVLAATILVGMNWEGLTSNLYDRVLSVQNLLILLVVYPFIKVVHELGHGFAVKSWGGEVHEMGIMMLVFMPVPYVDASGASAFPGKWQRALVGAAGILVEMGLAALAAFVWVAAEPGLIRAAAFNVMLIGGASTILFNGNPLLRFDGYYVLADLLEIPNLGTRSNRYILFLIRRNMFGLRQAENPAHTKGEARWFVGYGVLAFLYRMVVMITIALFVATKFFFIGIMIASLAIYSAVISPLMKGFRYVWSGRELGNMRVRAQRITLTSILAFILMFFVIPAPHSTTAEGVIYMNEQARLVSGSSGFVEEIIAEPGQPVAQGDPLIRLRDEILDARVLLLEAQQQEYRASFEAVNLFDPVQAEILKEQLLRTEASLTFSRNRKAALIMRAGVAGVFILPGVSDLVGRYTHEGREIGYVMPSTVDRVLVTVPQHRLSLVQNMSRSVSVRLEGYVEKEIPAVIIRQTPSAIDRLPSAVLGSEGGGDILLDPSDTDQLKPLDLYYEFELAIGNAEYPVADLSLVDGRVYVRFSHPNEPVGFQILRAVRQVFLKVLNV